MKISASMVLYFSDPKLVRAAVDSLQASLHEAGRLWPLVSNIDLVNNNKSDERKGEFVAIAAAASSGSHAVTYVESDVNGGYGAGNNISIVRNGDAAFHIVLNPDVIVQRNAVAVALSYMEREPGVGLLTPQVRGLDGNIVFLCKRDPKLFDMLIRSFPAIGRSRWFVDRERRYLMLDRDYSAVIRPVPYPTGCFMFFRGAVLRAAGLFDEGYFLHYEDADIGRRVNAISECAYLPEVVVMHKWSRDTHKSWRMRLITIRSGLRYFKKWGGLI